MNMQNNGKKRVDIPLELVADYPIKWDFKKALRDFIQNFYDALGPDKFGSEFDYDYYKKEQFYTLVMKAKGKPFSHELLSYIGSSTKSDDGKTIGKYGEGFKMACLSAYKMGISVVMHSEDWELIPATYSETIDDRDIEMFGYMLNHVENDGITSLTMENIPSRYYSELQQGLLDFFYPENPLFGELIGKGDNYTIYSRSSMAIPCHQYAPDLKGVLYINNLARGRLPFSLIVNLKAKHCSDLRSRPTLDELDTYSYLYNCMDEWTPGQSATVLRMLHKSWSDASSMKYSGNTNYYYVCQLVRNVANDKAVAETFAEDMKNYCYFEKKTGDTIRNTYIKEAQRWWKSNPNGKRKINPIFRLLGAENMVETYLHTNSGNFRKPTKQEQDKYKILSACITSIIPFLSDEDVPPVEIDSEIKSEYSPLQFASRVYMKKSNGRRYKINKLILREQDFDENVFTSTLLKLSEDIFQIYGSSRSARYNAIFTHLGEYLLDGSDIIDMAQLAWKERSQYA